jgi:hypothetical protein
MNIYKVTRNEPIDYDTFDSFVVVAPDQAAARRTHPATSADLTWDDCYGNAPGQWYDFEGRPERMDNGWTDDIEPLTVTLIGRADGAEPGVVVASFNAG